MSLQRHVERTRIILRIKAISLDKSILSNMVLVYKMQGSMSVLIFK